VTIYPNSTRVVWDGGVSTAHLPLEAGRARCGTSTGTASFTLAQVAVWTHAAFCLPCFGTMSPWTSGVAR